MRRKRNETVCARSPPPFLGTSSGVSQRGPATCRRLPLRFTPKGGSLAVFDWPVRETRNQFQCAVMLRVSRSFAPDSSRVTHMHGDHSLRLAWSAGQPLAWRANLPGCGSFTEPDPVAGLSRNQPLHTSSNPGSVIRCATQPCARPGPNKGGVLASMTAISWSRSAPALTHRKFPPSLSRVGPEGHAPGHFQRGTRHAGNWAKIPARAGLCRPQGWNRTRHLEERSNHSVATLSTGPLAGCSRRLLHRPVVFCEAAVEPGPKAGARFLLIPRVHFCPQRRRRKWPFSAKHFPPATMAAQTRGSGRSEATSCSPISAARYVAGNALHRPRTTARRARAIFANTLVAKGFFLSCGTYEPRLAA